MSEENSKERRKLIQRLRDRYRLVVLNDTTFDERFSASLTPLNVISAVALVFFVILILVVSVIVFTPIKEYIPGYGDTQTRLNAMTAAVKADSLQEAQRTYAQYFDNLQRVLSGEIAADTLNEEGEMETQEYENLDFSVSKEDSILRDEIESQERYTLLEESQTTTELLGLPKLLFFVPMRGTITDSYDASIEHYGVDITAPEGEPVMSVYDGTVLFSSFTSDGGYVIQVQHPNNLISIYKHNSVLLKKVGDPILAGETIAIIGNSGEFTDGPHLHFELWHNGKPLNPQDFISFSADSLSVVN